MIPPRTQPEYTAHWESFKPGLHLVRGIPHIGYGFRISNAEFVGHNELSGAFEGNCDERVKAMLNGDEDWLPREVADFWLQKLLEGFVGKIMDRISPEAWRAMDPPRRDRVGRHWPLGHEVRAASPRQVALLDVAYQAGTGGLPGFWNCVSMAALAKPDPLVQQTWRLAHDHLLFVDPAHPEGERTAYSMIRVERAELNARVILTGEWPA